MSEKFCVDCEYCQYSELSSRKYFTCLLYRDKLLNGEKDFVTGETLCRALPLDKLSCYIARQHWICGKTAIFFKPADPETSARKFAKL